MSRPIVGVTLDNLEHLPKSCRRCVYWEVAPHLKAQAEEFGETEVEKEAWVSGILLEWGSCGRIVYSDHLPVGFVLYAPPNAVPRANAFPTSPPSPDSVLLTAFQVLPEFRGGGLGRMLVQAVAKDLTRRGVKAIEAFGDARPTADTGYPAEHTCVVPADFLSSLGFKTVRPHPM
ncbi:MAG: GNAT family N-acetyltransferase, partial [Pseudonocardiaceae bacterium]